MGIPIVEEVDLLIITLSLPFGFESSISPRSTLFGKIPYSAILRTIYFHTSIMVYEKCSCSLWFSVHHSTIPWQSFVYSFGHHSLSRTTWFYLIPFHIQSYEPRGYDAGRILILSDLHLVSCNGLSVAFN